MLEYNPKVDYLFSKKIIKHKDSYNQDENYYRDIFYKRIKDIRDEKALFLSKMSNAIDYLKDVDNLSLDIIKHTLILLDYNTQINDEKLVQLLFDIHNNNNPYTSINTLISIIKENIFSDDNINLIMGALIHNYINFHNGFTPVIFDYESITKINKFVKEDKIDIATSVIIKRYAFTSMYNHKNTLRDKEEVTQILKSFCDKHKKEFGINEIYIYGSYLRGTQTEYSDVDLYAVISDEKYNDNLKFQLISILKSEYDLCADLSIEKESEKLTNLTNEQKRELTRII